MAADPLSSPLRERARQLWNHIGMIRNSANTYKSIRAMEREGITDVVAALRAVQQETIQQDHEFVIAIINAIGDISKAEAIDALQREWSKSR
jgi:hypothetical protein